MNTLARFALTAILLPFWLVYFVLTGFNTGWGAPYYTRNHDGDTLRFWMGRRWVRSQFGGPWKPL